jgi:hypothetical protein
MPKSIRKLFLPAMTRRQFPSELLARDITLKSVNRISTPVDESFLCPGTCPYMDHLLNKISHTSSNKNFNIISPLS